VTTKVEGTAVVQTAMVHSGTRAARLKSTSTTGSAAYLRKSLSPVTEVTAGGWFNLQAEGLSGGNVPFIRMFDGAGTRVLSLFRQNFASDQLYVQHSGAFNKANSTLPLGTWAELSVRVVIAGTASTVEVRKNGTLVYQTNVASLGTSPIATIQVGNDTNQQPFDIVVDDVTAASPTG
jgi:hypothetical protein